LAARFYVGVDLGQSRDYTAVAVGEKITPPQPGGRDFELHMRHLERFRDVAYPDIVERLRKLMEAPQLRGGGAAVLAVDATGVGKPVVDMLRSSGLTFDAVAIHGGDTQSEDPASGHYRVPKRDLIGGMQVLLQSGRLEIARSLEHAETLRAELLNFRVKINVATAHDTYEAWREGDHDDLVLAAALSCWAATKPGPTLAMI
jgi:hypothetical protein